MKTGGDLLVCGTLECLYQYSYRGFSGTGDVVGNPSVQASCVAFGFTVSQLRNTMSLQLQSRGQALIESKHYML